MFFEHYLVNTATVSGPDRDVVVCELRPLTAWLTSPHGAQPPVKFSPVPHASACTVLAFKQFSHGRYLAVATTESVVLYQSDSTPCSFTVFTVI